MKPISPNLIITCAGDSSLHLPPNYGTASTCFDTLVLYFGSSKAVAKKYKKEATYFYSQKGCKWQLVRFALEKLISNKALDKYQYIWIPDDDIKYSEQQAKDFFFAVHALDCPIAQPSILPLGFSRKQMVQQFQRYLLQKNQQHRSEKEFRWFVKDGPNKNILEYISHVELLPQSLAKVVRHVTNIEVQCPVLSTALVGEVYHKMLGHSEINPNGVICSGWSLEQVWRYLVRGEHMCIIDFISVEHTKPLSHRSKKKTWYDNFGNNPWKESEEVFARWEKEYGVKLKPVPYKTLRTKPYPINPMVIMQRGGKADSNLLVLSVITPKNPQSYWHFMLAEFFPVIYQVAIKKPKQVIIQTKYTDYPWVSFYDEVSQRTGVKFVLEKHKGGADIEPWDYKFNDGGKGLLIAVNFLLKLAKIKPVDNRVVFQIRNLNKKSENFYGNNKEKIVKINFVHIPKTGGTAIKKALSEHVGKVYEESIRLKNKNKQSIEFYSSGHRPIDQMWSDQRVFNISTIRHPVDRIASAFYYLKEGAKKHPFQQFTGGVAKWQKYLKKYNNLESLLRDRKAIRFLRETCIYFRPLSYWIIDDGYVRVDVFVRQENLSEDMGKVMKSLKINEIAFPETNKTGKNYTITDRERHLMKQVYADEFKLYNQIIANLDKTNAAGIKKLTSMAKGTFWGDARRKVGNLEEIANKTKNAVITKDDGKTLFQQIEFYANKKTLVLGHGAGMVNILWMPAKSRIVEIISKLKAHEEKDNGAVQGALRLSELKGSTLTRITVDKEHDNVDEKELATVLGL
jgi:hypothetical protein